jgi:hypothetical protein
MSGWGLCDGLNALPDKWRVCDRKASMMGRLSPTRDCWAIGRRKHRRVTLAIDSLFQRNISIFHICIITHYDKLRYGHAQWMLTVSCWVRLQEGDDILAFASSLWPDVPAIPNCSKTTRYVTIMEPSCNKITAVKSHEGKFRIFHPASCSWWEIFVAPVKSLRLTIYSKKNEHCFIVTHGAVQSGVIASTFQRMCPGSSEKLVNI